MKGQHIMLGSVTQQKRCLIVHVCPYDLHLWCFSCLVSVSSGPEEEMMLPSPSQLGCHHGRQKKGTMARNLSKCVFVFLVLALSGLIFLLRSIRSVEVRRGSMAALSLPNQAGVSSLHGGLRTRDQRALPLFPHVEQ